MQQSKSQRRCLHEKVLLQVMVEQFCRDSGHIREKLTEDEEIRDWAGRFGRRRFASAYVCESCRQLLLIGWRHTKNCPRMEEKTFCHHCPKPCYRKTDETRIREVMCQSGRRLLWRHPLLALQQLRYVWWAKRNQERNENRDKSENRNKG